MATVTVAELARRRKTCVDVGGRAIALFLLDDGTVAALADTCIHQGRPLSRGILLRGRVVCPGHGWAYDPQTGIPDGHDGRQPVHDVEIVDGVVHVDPTPRA